MGDERSIQGEASGRLRYRRQSRVGGRQPRGLLRYTDDEWAVIVQVAVVDGMRPGAWAQRAAVDAARRQRGGGLPDRVVVEALLVELRQHRRVLANIGGNLNDLAKAANATGVIGNPVAAQTVLRLVRHVVLGADEVIRRVRAELLA